MEQQDILQLTAKKHIKIYKLHQLGLDKKAIAAALGTNVGHVYNVLKDYAGSEEKRSAADLIETITHQ